MKIIKTILGVSGLALSIGLIGTFSTPADTGAFALLGHSLGAGQRDFRVFNNFTDSSANNNASEQGNFPGATGAVLAIWKGHAEWSSVDYAGDGGGDPTQSKLGNREANFDNTFQGEAQVVGSIGQNIHSELAGSSGGTLAFMQGGSNGWWVRYLSSWTWQDGPSNVGSGVDLQGVACHEIGHTLGLNHSNVSGATMLPSISGTGVNARSTNSDDKAGLQAIYGVMSATKPLITALSGSSAIGGALTITGANFSTSANNDIWFTMASSAGVAQKVQNLTATAGGTQIVVTVPPGITDGEVLVRNKDGTGGAFLSNAWPIDLGAPVGDLPFISSINDSFGPAGGFSIEVISGSGFAGTTSVTFGGVEAVGFTVDSGSQITVTTPAGPVFTQVDIVVTDDEGSSSLVNGYLYSVNPTPNISGVAPNTGDVAGGTTVTITGSSVVGVGSVTFGGNAGVNLSVNTATSLTVDAPAGSAGAVDVVAFGSGSDTLSGAFTYTGGGPGGAFVDIGPGVAGIFGALSYTGVGDLTPGSLTGYSTTVSNGIPGNTAFLFLSLTQAAAPFKGGTLYALPIDAQISLPLDGTGSLTLPHIIPAGAGFDGIDLIGQWWCPDAAAPVGASGSNGLRLEIP
ncbi:MAG: hypothetical protein ACI9EF_000065 [Pseudohongiellaceae bacterium]|jgi:hypothetical protein